MCQYVSKESLPTEAHFHLTSPVPVPPIAWGSGLQFMFPICIMGPCQQFINYTLILSNIFYLVEVPVEDITFPAMDSFSLPPVDNGVIVCLSTHALMQWWAISHHSYPSLSSELSCFKNKYQMEKEVHRSVTKYLFKILDLSRKLFLSFSFFFLKDCKLFMQIVLYVHFFVFLCSSVLCFSLCMYLCVLTLYKVCFCTLILCTKINKSFLWSEIKVVRWGENMWVEWMQCANILNNVSLLAFT